MGGLRLSWFQVLSGIALSALPVTALAQDAPGVYVIAGGAMALRQSGYANTPEPVTPRHWLPTVRGGVGLRVEPGVAIEVEVGIEGRQSFPWEFFYIRTEELVSDRDIPIVAFARFSAGCAARLCVDVLAGGGFTWHHAESRTLARCTHGFTRCDPLSGREEPSGGGSWEFTVGAGVDVLIRTSARVSVGPSIRVYGINRRQHLVINYDHRSPLGGDGLVAAAGITLKFGVRR